MKKLCSAVDRFCARHPRFGIPNLMKFIVIGNVVVYLLTVFAGYEAVSLLGFSWAAVARGQLWRLVTFIFMPGYTSQGDLLWLVLFLYLYYMIGTTLEREWGTAKFSLYYFSGVALTVLVGIIAGLVFRTNIYITGADYVNMSMFFAFAVLFPDTRFMLFFFIPIKVKWLAWFDAVIFAIAVVRNLFTSPLLALLPVVALLNFFVFFWNSITDELAWRRNRARHQTSHQTIQFKAAARQQQKKEAARGYRHKCAVCGRTDTDFPELEFRYCSRCAGYHCFCQDHIFSHEHFTE